MKKTTQKLQKQVDNFNAAVPIGSEVSVKLDSGESRITTVVGEALLLGGHTPCVFLKGISGAYLLERVSKIAAVSH